MSVVQTLQAHGFGGDHHLMYAATMLEQLAGPVPVQGETPYTGAIAAVGTYEQIASELEMAASALEAQAAACRDSGQAAALQAQAQELRTRDAMIRTWVAQARSQLQAHGLGYEYHGHGGDAAETAFRI